MVDYKKKIRFCESLGASKFQKVVFKIEEVKWNTLKKFCPNFIHYYDKFCDFKMNRKLSKVHSENEKKKIKYICCKEKLLMRKEFNRKQNRNYHMDKNKPTEFMKYLKWNKQIHTKGLVMDLISIPILLGASFLGIYPASILLGYNIFSLFVNFQCINIQNCNIYRMMSCEERLIKMERIQYEHKMENYSEGIKVISNCMREKENIPTMDEIINNIQSKEQLEQLRGYVLATRDNMRKELNLNSDNKAKKR